MSNLKRDHHLGEVLEKRATHLLEIGAPYNEESGLDMLEDRFKVSLNIIHGDTFRILDRACCISVNIAWGHLEDPEFNLIEWYGAKLLKMDLRKLQEVLSSPGY